jgi:hypothetical protein
LGDKLLCEYRGREVVVGGVTDAPIQWPYARAAGPPGPIVCGELIRAVQTESAIAVAHHWGVSTATVKKWRRALGVPASTNGTRRLRISYGYERMESPENWAKLQVAAHSPEARAKLQASCLGRPPDPKAVAALRKAAQRPKSEDWKRGQSERSQKMWANAEDHGLRAQHHWTDDEIATLGTMSDQKIAAAMNLPLHVIVHKRRSLHRSSTLHSWTDDEIRLLGTDTDQEVARTLGRSVSAVRAQRQKLRIRVSVFPWSEEEIALLGTDTDENIGRRLRKHPKTVRTKRKALGIPPFLARWTEEEISWLGVDTDEAIAKALGRSPRAVATQRVLRGIPAYCEPGSDRGDRDRKKRDQDC